MARVALFYPASFHLPSSLIIMDVFFRQVFNVEVLGGRTAPRFSPDLICCNMSQSSVVCALFNLNNYANILYRVFVIDELNASLTRNFVTLFNYCQRFVYFPEENLQEYEKKCNIFIRELRRSNHSSHPVRRRDVECEFTVDEIISMRRSSFLAGHVVIRR